MSLSSYFTKKSSQRKTRSINLSFVSPETGEKHPISLRPKKSSIGTAKATSEETKSSSTSTKDRPGSSGPVGSESQIPPIEKNTFTFGFILDEDDIPKSSKAKKRRNRGKKKNKNEKGPLLNAQNDSDLANTNIQQQTGLLSHETGTDHCTKEDTKESTAESHNLEVVPPSISSSICDENIPMMSSHQPSEKVSESFNLNQNNNRNVIRTPPGFRKLPLKQRPQQTSQLLPKSHTQSGTAITTPKAIIHPSLHETIPSKIHDRSKSKERKLRFNPSEKGHAMVNHYSLAIRNERIEEKVGTTGDSNAFSFGFTFDSLLKDYL
jgi:hypothetical protein